VVQGRGRRPRYCRPSHRQRAYEERRLDRARASTTPVAPGGAEPSIAAEPASASSTPKQLILAAARALLVERGLDGTTMRAIANRAGVAYGTVSYHFGSKEQLLLQVLKREASELQRHTERAWKIEDPRSRRRSLRQEMKTTVDRKPDFFKLRFELYALALRNQSYRSEVAQMLSAARAATSQSLSQAGFFTEDSEHLAPLVQAALDGLALQSLMDASFDHGAAHDLLTLLMAQFRRARERRGRRGEGA